MKFLDGFKDYISQKKPVPSPVTIKNYISDIRKFILWVETATNRIFDPKEITKETIALFEKETVKTFSLQSVNRYLSSLRNFFSYLKKMGEINNSPFESTFAEIKKEENATDPWFLRQFKNYLLEDKASSLTIKNYLIDAKQFLVWAKTFLTESGYGHALEDKDLLKFINKPLIETYKSYLINNNYFSASSINRKLSSLRKYLLWGQQQILIPAQTEIKVSSLPSKIIKKIPQPVDLDKPIFLPNIEEPKQENAKVIYSRIPPIRMLQKSFQSLNFLIDKLFVTPQVRLIKALRKKIWEIRGRKIFKEKSFSFYKYTDQNISKIRNIPKASFDFENVSLENLSPLQKFWMIIRYKRPKWYKRYHNSAFEHSISACLLIIVSTVIGISIYSNFFKMPKNESLVLGAKSEPQKKFLFTIKLTDKNGIPITSQTNLRFAIYDDPIGSDSANHRIWEGLQTVKPNTDGLVSVNLGTTDNGQLAPLCNNGTLPLNLATHPCGIPGDILSTHDRIFLGITIGDNPELTPREQLANVSLANDSQSLQGLIPTTDSNLSANTNAVLALNSSGVVSIPGNNATTIESPAGSLEISGNGLRLSSGNGTNANVQIYADGFGLIDIQKPISNSTNYNNIRNADGSSTAAGAVEVDDLFAILATSSGQSAFTINQDGNGPIISASSSGTAKFTVDKDGNVIANGNINGSSFFGKSLGISGNIISSLIPANPTEFDLGAQFSPWGNIYAQNYFSPQSGGVAGYIQMENGAISPTNISNDLLIGGNSTSSAVWHVFATGDLAGTASSSGNLVFTGINPKINILNGYSLNIQTSANSENGLISRFFIGNNGNIGINNSSPTQALDVTGTIRASNLSGGATALYADAQGNIVRFPSDINLKTNIQPISDALEKVLALQGVTYEFKDQARFGEGEQIGFIAQQIEPIVPDVVSDGGEYKSVNYPVLTALLVEAIKQQQVQIASLSSIVNNLSLTSAGNLSIIPDVKTGENSYSVVDSFGQLATTLEEFANIFVGNLTAGAIHSETIFAKNINISGQSLQDYITGIVEKVISSKSNVIISPISESDEIHTHILSPLGANTQIAIALNDNSLEIRKNASGSAVVIIDNNGNASFSGSLKSNDLAVNSDATVSGTLYAHKIKVDEIDGPLSTNSAQYITNITNNYYATQSSEPIASMSPSNQDLVGNTNYNLPTNFVPLGSTSALLTYIPTLQANTATFEQGLMSLGPTALSDTSITGQLSINGQLILSDTSINVLGGDLQLQPLQQGGVSIAGGLVKIDSNGNLTVNGNAVFNNSIYANIISPLPNQDLNFVLGSKTASGNTGSLEGQDDNNQKLVIKNASGSAVVSINSIGDLIASGSATVGKLNFSIIPKAEAISEFEVVATGSAGTTSINPYHRELTIDNPSVTKDSLIYISPVGSSTQQPFLLRQVPQESFTVGIKQPSAYPVQFNWLIIN